jgi:hypothetical protein
MTTLEGKHLGAKNAAFSGEKAAFAGFFRV